MKMPFVSQILAIRERALYGVAFIENAEHVLLHQVFNHVRIRRHRLGLPSLTVCLWPRYADCPKNCRQQRRGAASWKKLGDRFSFAFACIWWHLRYRSA